MKNWLLLPLLGASLAIQIAGAKELDAASYINKISERLTGQWPTTEEFDKVEADLAQCQTADCKTEIFRGFIREKMNTPDFYNEAVLKVFERFAFPTPKTPPVPLVPGTTIGDSRREMLQVYKAFQTNAPIDSLYTGQISWSLGLYAGSIFERFEFQVESENPVASEKVEDKIIDPSGAMTISQSDYTGHPNIAGLFSTKMFLDRYWNSPLNGNRKRAAAVFKIMLCDPMAPALERLTQTEREEALARGAVSAKVSARTIEEIHKNRHGNQADCAKCHTRLDPLARTMRPLELAVSKWSSPGRLRFNNALSEMQDIPVANFHELIVKATEQPRYDDCQLNWLVNWIVGKDIRLHPQRFMDLLATFRTGERRVKSMIEELLLSPEFRGMAPIYTEPQSFKQASEVLSNCTECHFSWINARGDQLKGNLQKVARRLDLPNDGGKRSMPPSYHWWQPSAGELKSVKQWLEQGAPLVEGKAFLSPDEVQRILPAATRAPQSIRPTMLKSPSLIKKASFEETYERYPSPYAVVQQFKRIVPHEIDPNDTCINLSEGSAPMIGVIDPLQGTSLEQEPGAMFFAFYQDCVRRLTKDRFEHTERNAYTVLSPTLTGQIFVDLNYICDLEMKQYNNNERSHENVWRYCLYTVETRAFKLWWRENFSKFGDTRKKFISRFIAYLVGPEALLRNNKYIAEDSVFGLPIRSRDELVEFLIHTLSTLKNESGNELTLLEAYAETAIILRLGPALKH